MGEGFEGLFEGHPNLSVPRRGDYPIVFGAWPSSFPDLPPPKNHGAVTPLLGKLSANEPRKLTPLPLTKTSDSPLPGFLPDHLAPTEGAIFLIGSGLKREPGGKGRLPSTSSLFCWPEDWEE